MVTVYNGIPEILGAECAVNTFSMLVCLKEWL
jgi:hypothetical protein